MPGSVTQWIRPWTSLEMRLPYYKRSSANVRTMLGCIVAASRACLNSCVSPQDAVTPLRTGA
jgi:hypothetical protein